MLSTHGPRPAGVAPAEPARGQELSKYRVRDISSEAAFNDLAALAAEICATPMALVTFLDDDCQWIKASVGLTATETELNAAFCAHTVARRGLVEVPDAQADERFAANPFVTGDPHIRFYAGVPLFSRDGQALGALCVLDCVPRNLSGPQEKALEVLSRFAMSELELRRENLELDRRVEQRSEELAQVHQALRGEMARRAAARQALVESDLQLRLMLDATNLGLWEADVATARIAFNDRVRVIFGLPAGRFVTDAAAAWETVHPDDRAAVRTALQATRNRAEPYRIEHRILRSDGSVRWTLVRGHPEQDASGEVVRVRGVTLDITDLREAEAQLRALTRQLVNAQEAEGRRISAELHDRIGQNLTALSLNLNLLEQAHGAGGDDAFSARLEDSRELLRTTLRSVRDLVTGLRPAVLDDYGLAAGLQAHGAEIEGRSGVPVRVEAPEEPRLPPAAELALYRVAQEALTNAVRHAAARQVEIRLQFGADAARLEISDDGRGFEVGQARPGHWGLVIMRERAESVGGRLEVDSRPGGGTRITVTVPTG